MHFRGHGQLHGFAAQLALDIDAYNRPQPPDWSRPLPEGKPWHDMNAGAGCTAQIEADDRARDAAVAYLHGAARAERPWALVVGLVAPHPPYIAPPRFREMYAE